MKKGFTLIELLAVIIILGVVLGLAVGIYANYLAGSRNKSYNIAENSLKTAALDVVADCLVDGNKEICQNRTLLEEQFDYDLLYLSDFIAYDYMDSIRDPYNTDLLCSENSYVYITNKANTGDNKNEEIQYNKDLEYKTCLICSNYKSKECLEDIELDSDYNTYCSVSYDEAGLIPYDGNWTDQDLYLTLTSDGNYKYGINYYTYRYGSNEKRVTATNNSAVVKINTTIDEGKITVTAFDGTNSKKTATCRYQTADGKSGETIRLDKSEITNAKITGTLAYKKTEIKNDEWASEDVLLTVTTNPKDIPSGLEYVWYKDGVKIDGITGSTYIAKEDGTYYAEISNGLGKPNPPIKTNEFVIKIDREAPTIASKKELVITPSQTYDFRDNVTSTFGRGGGEVTCNPPTSSKLGEYKVTCTALGNNKLKETVTFTVQIDNTVPTIKAKKQLLITDSQNYDFKDNLTWKFGISGGEVTCNPPTSSKLGEYTVTCTALGNNNLKQTVTFTVQIDNTVPTIAATNTSLTLGTQDYDFKDNVNANFGISGGEITCDPPTSLKSGIYNVTCTATGNNKLTSTITFEVRHNYPAAAFTDICYGCSAYDEDGDACCSWSWDGGCHITGGNCTPVQTCLAPISQYGGCCEGYSYYCTTYSCPSGGSLVGTTCYFY